MSNWEKIGGLQVAKNLKNLVEQEVLKGIELDASEIWSKLESILQEFMPRNKALLQKRQDIQKKIDSWHAERAGRAIDGVEYLEFLKSVGYIVEEGPDFKVETKNVDQEIAAIAGPQLVVPVMNARYALNAANARWGSLYDALYGTDVIPEDAGREKGSKYNPARGTEVIKYASEKLDEFFPLQDSRHESVRQYSVSKGKLVCELDDGSLDGLADEEKFSGYRGSKEEPSAVLLKHNGLHMEIQIDREDSIGKNEKGGVKDILVESALTTIQDCEDSVAAVDAADKVEVYRNWLGLMNGELVEEFKKNGEIIKRTLLPDREYFDPLGSPMSLHGRSLMLVRNVGHLMTNDAVLVGRDGEEAPEGILDAMFTSLIAMHDLKASKDQKNSRAGSIYIVKPKMHGPEEVEMAVDLFGRVEEALGLPENTIKIGIMDEERRTTVNLKECIRAARKRVIFINTGFLDRTGDEIHTSMEAGPVVKKTLMKQQKWIGAYESWNVGVGLKAGMSGSAQIGKGMWAMPDEMSLMMKEKIGHPLSGANTAWVPSPTAATLHALHYHEVNVLGRQEEIKLEDLPNLSDLLTIPLLSGENLSDNDVTEELENNAQSILGYVVRWIDQGVGCSKVPDINDVGLMEDRATLRISSQHIANWLRHGICDREKVLSILKKMAQKVDGQNDEDPDYRKMSDDFEDSVAFQAACDLIFKGAEQPSGYTEPVLHARRREAKKKYNLS